MRGNVADFPVPPTGVAGTPAGNGPYTQEQFALLRKWQISISDVAVYLMRVQKRLDWESAPIVVEMPCPVIDRGKGWFVAITPDGRVYQMPR